MNPYKILDLPTNATHEEIRKKYKSLAQTHHPDRGGDEETFKEIKLAYEILIDEDRRKQYDETGSTSTTRSKREEAIDQLAYIFFDVMVSVDMNSANIIEVVTNRIKESLMYLMNDKMSLDEQIKNCMILDGRITKKTKHDNNIFNQFIDSHINNLKQKLETIKYRIEVCEIMLDEVSDYEYMQQTLISNYLTQ